MTSAPITSARDGAASVEALRREAEDLAATLGDAADLPPQSATDESGHLTITVDATGRPSVVTLDAGWRDDLEPEDLAGAVQATAAMAEQQRLDAWTARLSHPSAGVDAAGSEPATGASR